MSWKTVKLGDIFEVARGGSPRPIESFLTNDENGVNWIMIGDTKDGGKYIEKTLKKIKREGVVNSRMVYEGDFLLTNSMSFGRPYILKTSGCIHDGWLVLSPKNENIHRDYFYYYLGSDIIKQKLSSKAAGAVVKNLNKEIVAELEVELPPLATQKRIAKILDTADALRRKDQELLKKYDELAQAIFIDMFGDPVKNEKGWEEIFLKDVCLKITDGTHQSPKFTDKGVPFLFVSNILKNKINYETSTFISKEEFDVLNKRTPIEVGNILITTVGSYGNPAVIETSSPFAFQRHIAFLKPNHRLINYYYLFGFLKSPATKNQIDRKVNGVAQKTLNLSDLKDLKIWTPPRSLQDKYSEILNKLQLQFNLSETNRSKILFNSLIQKAFKGELV